MMPVPVSETYDAPSARSPQPPRKQTDSSSTWSRWNSKTVKVPHPLPLNSAIGDDIASPGSFACHGGTTGWRWPPMRGHTARQDSVTAAGIMPKATSSPMLGQLRLRRRRDRLRPGHARHPSRGAERGPLRARLRWAAQMDMPVTDEWIAFDPQGGHADVHRSTCPTYAPELKLIGTVVRASIPDGRVTCSSAATSRVPGRHRRSLRPIPTSISPRCSPTRRSPRSTWSSPMYGRDLRRLQPAGLRGHRQGRRPVRTPGVGSGDQPRTQPAAGPPSAAHHPRRG